MDARDEEHLVVHRAVLGNRCGSDVKSGPIEAYIPVFLFAMVIAPAGRPVSVLGFTIHQDRIVAIDGIADPAKLDAVHLDKLS